MLNKTWRIVLLAVIIGFTLWRTMYSDWIILLAAVLLLVFEAACKGCSNCKNVAPMKASRAPSRPRASKTSKTSKKRRR